MSKYTLGDIFNGDYPISQYYGQRPEYYSQFGLAGHEGVDWATPTGVEIVAPFDGKIIRDNDVPDGKAYGDYIVVWDPVQKCAVWFCHLQDNNVSVDEFVHKGQVLGHTDNTGNSSGPHLHVNFVETDENGNRLNTDNGYQGFLNILDSNLVEWKLGNNQPIPQPINQVPPTVITDQTKIPVGVDSHGFDWGEMEVQAIRSTLGDQKNELESLKNAPKTPPVVQTQVVTPTFSSPLAKLFYSLAQAIG